MRRGDALLLSVVLALSPACDRRPLMTAATPCMVNNDCPELFYCDAPLATYQGPFCTLAAPGVCRPMEDSAYNAPCTGRLDCKGGSLTCSDQSHTCVTFACFSDPGYVVQPDQCAPGCAWGRRNYTCVACFCPSCPELADGGSL